MNSRPEQFFPADQRGRVENSSVKRYSTFGFQKENRKNVPEDLFLSDEEYIQGGKLSFYLSRHNAFYMFIPLNGSMIIVQEEKEYAISTGQILVLQLGKGEVLEISNTHPHETVNYLQLGLLTDAFVNRLNGTVFNYDLKESTNHIKKVISHFKLPFRMSFGHFTSDTKTIYEMEEQQSRLFCLITEGQFSIAEQIMQAKDSIHLAGMASIPLHALCDQAGILILEF